MIRRWSRPLALFGLVVWSFTVCAGEFPEREINFLVGFAPGGSTDTTIRTVATAASKLLGQPVVVTNKPGAGGAQALATLAASKPDGYMLEVVS
jgi:tripartite-type tricarboxylate transporter receptor subunit TctC